MRLELLIALWVGALTVTGLAVAHRPTLEAPQEVPQSGVRLGAMVVSPAALDSTDTTSVVTPGAPRRPLFRVASSPADVPSVTEGAPAPALPVLKGIIATADGWRAVFAATPDGADYEVVAAGESLGTIVIEDVAAEIVIARSTTGEVIRFMLRGSGEAPQ